MIRAVLFDLGGTLLEYGLEGRWRQFLPARLEELYPLVERRAGPLRLSPPEFAAQVAAVVSGNRTGYRQAHGRSWHFADRLRHGLSAAGVAAGSPLADELTEAFYQPISACSRLYPDTLPALEALRAAGQRLAIITNSRWDAPGRLVRSDLAGIASYFPVLACSGDELWCKPSGDLVLAAARALGVPPAQCLVVGDRLDRDVAAAAAAGMPSLWINRNDESLPAQGPQPTCLARSLSLLPTVWAELDRPPAGTGLAGSPPAPWCAEQAGLARNGR